MVVVIWVLFFWFSFWEDCDISLGWHKTAVAKSWGGKLKKCIIGCVGFWLYHSHNNCNLVIGTFRMCAPFWSSIMAFVPCICMVGLVAMISLSRLHSFVFSVRFGAIMGGQINI